jgi:hypothetical protein
MKVRNMSKVQKTSTTHHMGELPLVPFDKKSKLSMVVKMH